MPEHVHLLISEPQRGTLAEALKLLKQTVSRRLIRSSAHFWQPRYYDFNIRNRRQFVEKLRYIHRNPVVRVLYEHPEDWEWSSFRSMLPDAKDEWRSSASGLQEDASELPGGYAQPRLRPTQANRRLNGPLALEISTIRQIGEAEARI